MTQARQTIVDTNITSYYHIINRCVRRAFLCGDDPLTQRNYDHRKAWMVDRIRYLSSIFAIDICAYAVMSNHYHIVVKLHPQSANDWSFDEVIQRWRQLFSGKPLVNRYLRGESLTAAERDALCDHVELLRRRLTDLSWFMKCLNERIARDANLEDRCSGAFWEGRFKSYPLCDMAALLNCMVYVDLNPVRANVSETLETSDFTSIQERLLCEAKRLNECKVNKVNTTERDFIDAQPSWLVPFLGDEQIDKSDHGIFFSKEDYFVLVDWTGRVVKEDKVSAIPPNVKPILENLQLGAEIWLSQSKQFTHFSHHLPIQLVA